jgi:two-component system, cell cycle sensor histidine kinase DivJ
MLDAVRLEAGALKLAPEPVDLATEVASGLTTVRPDAERRRIALCNEASRDLPPLELDRRALRRILLNLLGNAVKFTEPGGSITLRAALEGDMIILAVADTGIGIAAEKIALLGRPFVQVDDSLTRRHAGSGLGLAICKGLAEAMGGTLHITSQVGRGTVVTVRLPAQLARSIASPVRPAA